MDFSSVIEFLQQFETKKVMAYVQTMDLKTVMEHPYFLTGVGVTAVIAYLMRWRLLLVTVMTITGFIYLLGYTLSRGDSLEGGMPTDALMVLVGGGAFHRLFSHLPALHPPRLTCFMHGDRLTSCMQPRIEHYASGQTIGSAIRR